MNLFKYFRSNLPLVQIKRQCCLKAKPKHLICFKDWTANMVLDVVCSAISLKKTVGDTHGTVMDVLKGMKVMILQEVNEPVLNMAVSKAATMLGACDVNITDQLVWEYDYNGRVFSYMADAIFVATTTHMCVKRFSDQSSVPVICMRSRSHASIQALATVMAIMEEYGTLEGVNVAYLGRAHQVLNSYLLLCPMLGANIKYKCCCNKVKVTPLLFKIAEQMTESSHTEMKPCETREELLRDVGVVISGPACDKKDTEKIKEFQLSEKDIMQNTRCQWIYFHTCPRGAEVGDHLFNHGRARTFRSFENMQFIAAALMLNCIKGDRF